LARQHHDGDVTLGQFSDQVDTLTVWEVVVEQDAIESDALDNGKALSGRRDLVYQVPGTEQAPDGFSVDRVVVDDENVDHAIAHLDHVGSSTIRQ
jgi:hypothetical protein